MATTTGARLLGQAPMLGRLLPGAAADLVLVDLRRPLWPWTAPETDPLSLILLRAARGDVDTVLVGGDVVWREGAPTGFDMSGTIAEVAARVAAALFPAERDAAADVLTSHIEAWYGAHPARPLAPFTIFNSRK
jgi:cytosine/adenosine deaminase-related metal-dependent hydrolase